MILALFTEKTSKNDTFSLLNKISFDFANNFYSQGIVFMNSFE